MKTLLTILTLLLFSFASSAQGFCCVLKSNTTGGNYTVEKVVRLNFSNQYESSAQQPGSPVWNLCGATDLQVQTPGGFVKSSLLDETGAASGWSVTNVTAFQGTTGSAPTPTSVSGAPANSGLWQDGIMAYAWIMATSGDMIIRIHVQDNTKSYQIHLLVDDENWKNSLVSIYVGAITSTVVNGNYNYGASTDNEYTASYVCHLKNVHGDASSNLDVHIHSSNGNNPNIVGIVVQQTNVDVN